MTQPVHRRGPMRLQTRLLLAVTGIVSVIIVIIAAVTGAMLSRSLEESLDQELAATASDAAHWTRAALLASTSDPPQPAVTASGVLSGKGVRPGFLFLVAPVNTYPTGVVVEETSTSIGLPNALSEEELRQIAVQLVNKTTATVSLDRFGSYRVMTIIEPSGMIVVGLPRADSLRTLAALFTTITLATLGGLLLLALTMALTIRVSLRPLRAVAATATRVAHQPLSEGTVSISERVPTEQADPRTETGMVGASLNVLLDHVETSLRARAHKEDEMRRFVADASHELRTPLASIRGYSELSLRALAGENPDAADTRLALERIQAQSLRMTRLVEDLLLLARLDEGRELITAPIDLGHLALDALADARPTGPGHRWQVEVPEQPVLVAADAGRLHQVAANLLANALAHTPEGTTITLGVSAEPDAGILHVHDDGPGIDPTLQAELFSRFVRGDSSRTRQTGGTGLGLAIAKAIVDGHGGTLEVESVPGSTTFTARIPRA